MLDARRLEIHGANRQCPGPRSFPAGLPEKDSMRGIGRTRKRQGGRQRWSRGLGIALCSLVLAASSAGAAPFTGAAQGFAYLTSFTRPDGTVWYQAHGVTLRGYTTTGGAMMCHGVPVPEPAPEVYNEEFEGVCGADELQLRYANSYACQFEGAEDIFYSTSIGVYCAPRVCLGAENPASPENCSSYSFTEHVIATGGTGIAAGSSGSWTFSGAWPNPSLEETGSGGIFRSAGTASIDIAGDLELADGSVAPAGAALEIPSPGTNVSGIGLISGWSCLGGELEVEFSDAAGVIWTTPVLHGSERGDTAAVCGDMENGFSATFNWNLLGAGERTARLIRNGEEVKKQSFMVTAFDDIEFVREPGMCTIADFPEMDQHATFVWEPSQQALV